MEAMKRILVFSDSHGSCGHMCEIVDKIYSYDLLVHCGDYSADAAFLRKAYPDSTVISVCGNNEYGGSADKYSEIIELGGVKIFVTHGHREGVRSGYGTLIEKAEREGCTLCLFGHTHRAVSARQNGIELLNPGSCNSAFGTYGVAEIENGRAKTAVINLR